MVRVQIVVEGIGEQNWNCETLQVVHRGEDVVVHCTPMSLPKEETRIQQPVSVRSGSRASSLREVPRPSSGGVLTPSPQIPERGETPQQAVSQSDAVKFIPLDEEQITELRAKCPSWEGGYTFPTKKLAIPIPEDSLVTNAQLIKTTPYSLSVRTNTGALVNDILEEMALQLSDMYTHPRTVSASIYPESLNFVIDDAAQTMHLELLLEYSSTPQ